MLRTGAGTVGAPTGGRFPCGGNVGKADKRGAELSAVRLTEGVAHTRTYAEPLSASVRTGHFPRKGEALCGTDASPKRISASLHSPIGKAKRS